jgi:hypothetical protein
VGSDPRGNEVDLMSSSSRSNEVRDWSDVTDALHPAATDHLPIFITAPGSSDVLINIMAVFLIDLPDLGTPLRRIAGSLEKMAGIEPPPDPAPDGAAPMIALSGKAAVALQRHGAMREGGSGVLLSCENGHLG